MIERRKTVPAQVGEIEGGRASPVGPALDWSTRSSTSNLPRLHRGGCLLWAHSPPCRISRSTGVTPASCKKVPLSPWPRLHGTE